jgi:hypothetical protein
MSERIFEVEHEPEGGVVIRIRPAKFLPLFPESARSHFWAAHKEGLLTLRDLIDAAVERAEREEKTRRTREKVEVE